jgi:hypothetical protein
MKNPLVSFALLLVSVAAQAQQLAAHAGYQGPGNTFTNAILVPAGDDKLVSYGGSANQLLCYDANLQTLWKSETLGRKEQFVGDLTMHHDTIAAFAIKQEAGSKAEIIALQRFSLATGQLLGEQKVCGLTKDRPKGFPVGKLSPDGKSVYFITYASTGDGTSVTYTRYAFSTNQTATGTFQIPAKGGKLLEPVVSDEKVVFLARHSDTESGVYIHQAGSDRVITRTLEIPDYKRIETRLFATKGAAYVVVHAQDKDEVTQDLHIAKVDLADGSLQTSKNLPVSGKKEFLNVKNLHEFPNGRVCLFMEPFSSSFTSRRGTLEEYTYRCGSIQYFIIDETLRLMHQGKIEKNQVQSVYGPGVPVLSHASLLAGNYVHIFYSYPQESSFHVKLDMTGKVTSGKIENTLTKGNFNLLPQCVYLNGDQTMYAKTWKGMALSVHLIRVDLGAKGKLSLDNQK